MRTRAHASRDPPAAPGMTAAGVEGGKARRTAVGASRAAPQADAAARRPAAVSLAEPCAGKAAKLPFSENRTPPRIAAAPRPGAAGQNAVVSDPSLGVCALCAGSPPDAGPLPAGGALLSRRRRARVDHHRPLVPPALGAQPALATPCSLLFGRPPLSTTLSHDLAGLFCSLLDDPLAPVRFFVLKLCSGS